MHRLIFLKVVYFLEENDRAYFSKVYFVSIHENYEANIYKKFRTCSKLTGSRFGSNRLG
jgi:hypothetical protein